MNGTKLALLSFCALLSCACAGGESSSSSSSSSAEEPEYSARKVSGNVDLSFSTVLTSQKREITGSAKDLKFTLNISEMPNTLLDLFNPKWYEGIQACGDIYFSTIAAETKVNGIDATITIPTTTVPYALSQGDLYLDCTSVDLPDLSSLGINNPSGKKVVVSKPFANVGENAPEFDLPLADLPSLLMSAVDVETLDSYLSISRYDRETFLIQYKISTESIKALVEQFGMAEEIDVSQIDTYLPGLEGSTLDLYYNLRKTSFTGLGADVGFDLKLATIFPEYEILSSLEPIHVRLGLSVDQTSIEAVEMPVLEGYEPFTFNQEAA